MMTTVANINSKKSKHLLHEGNGEDCETLNIGMKSRALLSLGEIGHLYLRKSCCNSHWCVLSGFF